MAESQAAPQAAQAVVTADDVLDGNLGSPADQGQPQSQNTDTSPKPESKEKLSPKFQALIRRERLAIERERAAKAREEEFNSKELSFKEREAKLSKFESIKKDNPLEALALLGLSYQDLTQIALADGNIPPDVYVKRVEEKVDDLRRQQEERDRRAMEDEKNRLEQEERQADADFKEEINTYIKENISRYELISFEQNEDLVYAVIDAHYERTKDPETGIGKVLTIAEAADKVEQHLEQKYDKARNLNKVKAFLSRTEQNVPKPETNRSRETKTLNNQLSATPMPQATRPITDEERVRRAIAYAQSLKK